MYQLVYVSVAQTGLSWTSIDEIIAAARHNNRRSDITGLLVHDGARFLQIIEGEQAAVEATFARICSDRRHVSPMIISARDTEGRQFGTWDFALQEVTTVEDCLSFAQKIGDRVRYVRDRALRSLFTSFAHIDLYQEPYAHAA